ncbi:MSCRAMM family adhesin SdrC [Sporosarcina luteola]|uniref:MSCRAMM family adhesin SdrC n=1 Tax=Sporosarcina luteola TaxID=582850 RepID=UPI0020425DF9|nr:MSCRAMM family adhesin SdrC [Sporosarcina luteola]MCM3745256.1 MSCRAMM family adhesin SdrC [Sporosarcina luteola]
MKNRWKKTGAALLIAGLTISGTGYALADEKAGKLIDLTQLNEDASTEAVEETPVTVDSPVKEVVNEDETDVDADKEAGTETDEETDKEAGTETDKETDKEADVDADKEAGKEGEATETDENELPEIPEGYTAGNLAALAKAYEQAGNPTAKAAIKRNMERAIAKWESKQPVVEAPKEEVKETAPVTKEAPKVEEPAKENQVTEKAPVQEEKPAKVKVKNPQAELNAVHKEQKETLKAAQKAERETLKEERKAAKELEKQEKKEKKN